MTVWTSPSTVHAQSRVTQIIRATRDIGVTHDSITTHGHSADECTDMLNSAFNRLVSMTMSDASLHIVAVVPMYEDDADLQIETLFQACTTSEHNITLHILALAPGIRHIFDATPEGAQQTDMSSRTLRLMRSLHSKATFPVSYSLLDDYVENGAPIGFTLESLSQYIVLLQIAMLRDYYKILSPALLSAHHGDNLAIGVSSLSFNRAAVARQLLGLGFLEALNYVGINDKEVDAQKAAREAETVLLGITRRYPDLYEKSIKPLYKEQGADDGRVAALASPILDQDINNLKHDILSLLRSDSLSMPEKEAVLAMILGHDNENIRGMQYEHEGTLLDDACEQPLDLFINAFNRYCKDSTLLPVRGDYEDLKKYEWSEKKNKYVESDENLEAFNPLPEIKRMKQEIVNDTSFIRDKHDELDKLIKSVKQHKDVEEIKSHWHKPQGVFQDIEYKEQPLDQQYTPAPGLKIKESVDLRQYFTPTKNQMNLGSCTSFAVVSMYEAMMNRAGIEGVNEMSPAYLYFYSNVLRGRPAGGSNFYEQFEVLGKHGVCREDLYVYDAASPETKPSDQANSDASNHRVLEAKQIPLLSEADKSEALKRNHAMLTSALSEGYSVGISLKVYDNLGKDGGFILHPDDAPDAKEEGWHAMVIVGYSESNNFYIVRNSWGPEFGEDGYCYIPTAYIDDPDYLDFACIITKISDTADRTGMEVPPVVANFAGTESEIHIAAIRNVIAKVRVDLKSSQKLYAEYYKYYQQLVMQLTMPKVQNDIRTAAEVNQTFNFINIDDKKRELENSFVAKVKTFNRNLQYILGSGCLISLGLGIGWYFSESYTVMVLFFIAAGLTILGITGYKWWKRINRKQLQDELDKMAFEAKRQREAMLEMQIRFHVAGMWLQRFNKLSQKLNDVYERLVSYNSTLRAWQSNYSRQVGSLEIPEGQMFLVLDASPLLYKFFESNKDKIVKQVDLIALFENYQVDTDSLESTHQELRDAVAAVIDAMLADFNIVNFLLGQEYPYLKPVDIQNEISTLINVCQPSFRNHAMNATTPIRILIGNVPLGMENQWSNAVNAFFPMHPMHLQTTDTNSLILLTIHPQKSDI